MHIETSPSGAGHLVVDEGPDRRRCATCGHGHEEWAGEYTSGHGWDADQAAAQLHGITEQLHQVAAATR